MGGIEQAAGTYGVATVLAALPPEQWRVLHHLRWPGRPYATVDHVVVGPGGVFVLSTQSVTGPVAVTSGVLRLEGCRRDRAVGAAADAAASVREALSPGACLPPVGTTSRVEDRIGSPLSTVTPVLCFIRDERVLGLVDDVMVCSTGNLVNLLRSRPATLDGEQVQAVADRLSVRLERVGEATGGLTPGQLLRAGKAAVRTVGRTAAGAGRLPSRARAGRVSRTHRPVAPGSVVAVIAVVAVMAALCVRLDVVDRVGVLGSRAVDRVVLPTLAIGQTMTVPGGGVRPDLEVTVRTPIITRIAYAAYAAPALRPDQVLVAVPTAIRNLGQESWVSDGSTVPQLLSEGHDAHPIERRFVRVRAGEVLGARTEVRAGGIVRGLWVFAVPRGTEVRGVGLRVGPQSPEVVRWTLGAGSVRAR